MLQHPCPTCANTRTQTCTHAHTSGAGSVDLEIHWGSRLQNCQPPSSCPLPAPGPPPVVVSRGRTGTLAVRSHCPWSCTPTPDLPARALLRWAAHRGVGGSHLLQYQKHASHRSVPFLKMLPRKSAFNLWAIYNGNRPYKMYTNGRTVESWEETVELSSHQQEGSPAGCQVDI